jgi:hypothetical protein
MKWLFLVVAFWLGAASGVSASLSPRRESSRADKEIPPALNAKLPPQVRAQATTQEANPEFNITEETEVLLNGQPCKYAEVPGHANIIWMKVATDRKTVLKIHFRTRK